MPALEKTSNLYTACERVAGICKANKMNLSADAVGAIVVETVVNEVNDRFFTAKPEGYTNPIDWFTSDRPDAKKARSEVAAIVKITATASKNLQNSYLHPSGLMDKAETTASDVEFV